MNDAFLNNTLWLQFWILYMQPLAASCPREQDEMGGLGGNCPINPLKSVILRNEPNFV